MKKSHLIVFLVALAHVTPLFSQESRQQQLPNYPASTLLEKGLNAMDNANYKQAISYLNEAIQKDPDLQEAYFTRAKCNEMLFRKKAALTDYNILLALAPTHDEATFSRGIIHYDLANYTAAVDDFTNFLDLPKGETNSVFFRTSLYEKGSDKIITAQGSLAEVYNYLGLSYSALQRYPEAITNYDKALSLNPRAVDYLINKGIAMEKFNQPYSALALYKKAMLIEPDNGLASYNFSLLSSQLNTQETAIEAFDQVIAKDSTLAFAYTERGSSKLKTGDYQGALEDYNQALTLDPNSPDNWLNRGLAKEKLKDFNGAYEDFSQYIDMHPDLARGYLNRGNVLVKLTQYQEAIQNYDLALFYEPNQGLVYLNRGIAKYNIQDKEGACQDITTAKDLRIKQAIQIVNKVCQ